MSKKLLHTPEGVRDIYGTEYARKFVIEQRLRDIIHSYGYEPIQPPTFEYFDVFSREIGTTPSKELYKFFDKENNTLVLRPDFTPSIARCAAKYYMEERRPVRFSYVGNTFSNTSSLQGKLNEVTQLGAELINDASVEALKGAGLTHFQVGIGQVEYFKGLCQEAGLSEETEAQLREYISGKNYFAAQEVLMGLDVKEPYLGILLKAADMFENMSSLSYAGSLVSNPRSLGAIAHLEKLYEVLKLYGVEKYVTFDLAILSKYHYYTGVIFRAYTYGVGDAVVKGGRYDNLLHQFGKDAPAVGFAIVVDDLMEALARQKVEIGLPEGKRTVFYTKENYREKLAEVRRLRDKGIAVELVLGNP